MTVADFLVELDGLFQQPAGTVTLQTRPAEIGDWDSLQRLEFVLLVEEKLGIVVDGAKIGEAETVADLLAILDTGLEA